MEQQGRFAESPGLKEHGQVDSVKAKRSQRSLELRPASYLAFINFFRAPKIPRDWICSLTVRIKSGA